MLICRNMAATVLQCFYTLKTWDLAFSGFDMEACTKKAPPKVFFLQISLPKKPLVLKLFFLTDPGWYYELFILFMMEQGA